MATPVTDPAILALLEQPEDKKPIPVTDPAVLAQLEGKPVKEEKGLLSKVDDYVRAAANGMTFGLADRFAAGMSAATGVGGQPKRLSDLVTGNSNDYAGNLERERRRTGEFETEHPIASIATNIAGGAIVPIGAFGAAAKGAGLGMKVLRGSGAGAALGSVAGAASAPDWTDPGQTAIDTAKGAGFGAVLGGSLPLAGKAIGSGYNALADALTKPEGISRGASRHLIEALSADGPQAVQGQVDRLGPDAMLADTGPAMLGKAQGTSLNSDEGRSVLASALMGRNEGTNQRIMGDVNRVLGPAEDPQTVTNAIRAQRSELDSKSYPAALTNAPPVKIDNVMADLENKIAQSPVGSMEHRALTNLQKMLIKEDQKPVAALSNGVAAPVAEDATTAALRSKYGDAVADAFKKQAANVPAEKPPQSLLEFIASKGGLGPDSELEAIGAHGHTVNVEGVGRRKLVKQGGLPLDYAREAAEEAGYLRGDHNGTSTVNDLLDVIDAEMRGQKRYPQGFEGHVGKRETVARSEREQHEYDQLDQGFEDDLKSAGHGQLGSNVKERAIGLMRDEGLHPDEAVDRAVMQIDHESSFPGARSNSEQQRTGPASIPHDSANLLHKVKGELDNIIEYDAPGLGVPAGALQRQQAALKQMRGAINSALETQVPGYASANRQSAALAKRGESVEAGTQYLGSGKTTPSPDRFAAEFDPLSQGEKIAFAKGSRGNIERVLGTKANDLQALRGELQGEGGWNTAKIATVHGQEAADELASSVDRNLKFRDTYNKVVENSQTAQRQAAARGMKPEPSSEIPFINSGATLTGMTATAGKKALNLIADALRPDPTKSFGEVARILSAQGGQRDQHLAALIDVLSRRQDNAASASKVGDRAALVAALLGNGYAQPRPTQSQSQ